MPHLSDARLATELVELRRDLHRHPELGLDLPHTQARVLEALAPLPLEITRGEHLSSVTAVLRGTADGSARRSRTVLLRADMDALPIHEQTGLPFASTVPDVMHACGHDLHTSMLVGAAHLLSSRRDELAGDVVLMFQPGEENYDGAQKMIDEGVLDAAGQPVDAAYGLHVFSAGIPHGQFQTRPGPLMAAADEVHIEVRGVGGHGSSPQTARDPVLVIAELTVALQVMVTRRFDVFDPVVVTVGSLHAGTKANVIPETARLEASVRTFSTQTRSELFDTMRQLADGIAGAHGLSARVDVVELYPVTANDTVEALRVGDTVAELFGADRFVERPSPMAASEDFSKVLQLVPGSFVFLGATPRGEDPATAAYNHSARAVFDEDVILDGAHLYAELAVKALGETSGPERRHDDTTHPLQTGSTR